MIFKSPSWVPELPQPPDSIPISEFILHEKHGRRPVDESRIPYTCGLSGKSYTIAQIRSRQEDLAKSLAKELGWGVNNGTEYEKVGAIFSLNTVDLMMLSWAIHRLNGISCPANAAYSASELAFQLQNSRAQCLFTCKSLLKTAVEAARIAGISRDRIYLCPVPDATQDLDTTLHITDEFKSIDDLILCGKALPELEQQQWIEGQGKRQVAFICYSSGTSGLPKGVLISHYNVISNVLQRALFEAPWRDKHTHGGTEVVLGCLPFSHIYGLVLICHTSTYRGDQVIVLPKFEFKHVLESVARYKIFELFLVPPIVVIMTNNMETMKNYDLSSIRSIYTGAAPLARESVDYLKSIYPHWKFCQAYGLTESATVISSTSRSDIWPGSSGSLLPGAEIRIVSADGDDIDAYDTAGELWVKAPSVVLGYLENPRATGETFIEDANGRWLKTGDEAEVRLCPESGNEHVWIVDRIKELIKGNQVAPAELEALLLGHPLVEDCAVISIPDQVAGEAPKAYVVRSKTGSSNHDDEVIRAEILHFVRSNKTRHKWVKEIEFIDMIPKSASGKILRRILRDFDRSERNKQIPRARI